MSSEAWHADTATLLAWYVELLNILLAVVIAGVIRLVIVSWMHTMSASISSAACVNACQLRV